MTARTSERERKRRATTLGRDAEVINIIVPKAMMEEVREVTNERATIAGFVRQAIDLELRRERKSSDPTTNPLESSRVGVVTRGGVVMIVPWDEYSSQCQLGTVLGRIPPADLGTLPSCTGEVFQKSQLHHIFRAIPSAETLS